MYVVAGVSGNTGSVVANELLERGKQVRVIVRDAAKGESWARRGAEVAVGRLDDRAFLTRTLEGAEGAYLLIPPDNTAPDFYQYQRDLTDTFRAAIEASRLPHLVFLSSVGAQHPDGTGPIKGTHYAERQLRDVTKATFVRAAYFQENWASALQPVLHNGVLPTFIDPSLELPQVATKDIGLVAAKALLEAPAQTRIIELSGPRDYRTADVAETFSRLLGKPVQLVTIPDAAAAETLASWGVPPAGAAIYAELYTGVNRGLVAWEGKGATAVRGQVELEETLASLLKRG